MYLLMYAFLHYFQKLEAQLRDVAYGTRQYTIKPMDDEVRGSFIAVPSRFIAVDDIMLNSVSDSRRWRHWGRDRSAGEWAESLWDPHQKGFALSSHAAVFSPDGRDWCLLFPLFSSRYNWTQMLYSIWVMRNLVFSALGSSLSLRSSQLLWWRDPSKCFNHSSKPKFCHGTLTLQFPFPDVNLNSPPNILSKWMISCYTTYRR